MRAGFVPLHVHSQYSLLDGAIRLDDLLAKAQEFRLPAVAVTDHGNLFGAVEFFRKAQKARVKPIIGCEVYVSPTTRFDRETKRNYHLILLVRDREGYRNLCSLVSLAYEEGFRYKPRIDKDILSRYAGGLIGLSACIKGEVPRLLLSGKRDEARQAAREYRSILGAENFYLELQKNGLEEQERANAMLLELGEELDIPVVATNDCHYLNAEDARAHDALICIQTGKTLKDENRLRFSTDAFYFKSPDEMAADFAEMPEAVRNTRRVAERCNFEFNLTKFHLPHYEVPDGETLDGYLRRLVHEGLARRFDGGGIPEAYAERLEMELSVIERMGFPGYFLIVWDFINAAKERGIPVGPGRGSAAGSLVAYSLGITELDPLRYNLLFERFLNPERVSMPDIDVDFCMDRRGEVIDYVTDKYGADHVAQIITFGTMAARAVIRDVGRVMDIPYAEVDRVAKLVPNVLKIKLKKALEMEAELRDLCVQNATIGELMTVAQRLEGLNRHASTHAAGVVIAPEPLTRFLPLYKPEGEEGHVTQFDMTSVEALGLLKFDFLGLKTLTVIDKTEKAITRQAPDKNAPGFHDGAFSVSRIPLDDKAAYDLLSSGQTSGVFQLESSGMREILVRLRPEVFEDIIALVALYRPGPLGSGMVEDFIKRKKGEKPVEYELPELEPILRPTYGVILYQEQVMQIANRLAGFSMGQADVLRKAMGKKISELVDEQRELFLSGCETHHVPSEKAERIFDLIAYFAGYGFNKSHSAAYALIAYQTAFLKAHYPVAFMSALLSCDMDNTDKVAKYINECRDMKIPIRPPDINRSEREFTPVDDTIRFGLEGVKGVGSSALEVILEARHRHGDFESLLDFCSKVELRKVNRKVIESLIRTGAFDSLGYRRAQLMVMLDGTLEQAGRLQKNRILGQASFFDDEPLVEERPDVPEWDDKTRLRNEKETLGFYISGHPLDKVAEELRRFTTCAVGALGERDDKQTVTVGGVVAAIKAISTKKGDRMAAITLEDMTGTVEVVVFPGLYAERQDLIHGERPVVVTGQVERTDTGHKLLAKGVSRLGDLEASRVECRVNAAVVSEDDLARARSRFARHRGSCPLFLRLSVPGRWETLLSAGITVKPSMEMVREVEEILGRESVHLVGA